MSSDEVSEIYMFRNVFRDVFREVIGEVGLKVLEYHFRKISSSDMYTLLYNDPGRFYNTLTRFFGAGARALLRVVGDELITRHGLDDVSTDELLGILMGEGRNPRERLRDIVARIYSASRGR